jgi:hypothetical protein
MLRPGLDRPTHATQPIDVVGAGPRACPRRRLSHRHHVSAMIKGLQLLRENVLPHEVSLPRIKAIPPPGVSSSATVICI